MTRASEAKSRFLATASHDLRQPLQTISLLNGTLDRLANNSDIAEAVVQQEQAIRTMSALLNALLDISKLESGAVRPQIEDVELRGLFDELRVEFTGVTARKGLLLYVDAPHETVRTDRTLLGQILRNLLSNAIRYTHAGSIRLQCAREGELLRIEVQDTGIGIAADQITHIFDEFYQVGVSPNSVREGHGLGLSIVRRVARLLEHDISVQSNPGNGSVFSLLVPSGSRRAAPQDLRRPFISGRAPTRSRHVLIIEDDPSVLAATRLLLQLDGYRVSAAPSMADAINTVHDHSDFDLLITDFHLEVTRGLEVIRSVRDTLGRQLKAVLMTGDTPSAVKEVGRVDGVRFVSKPIRADELLDLISTMLAAE